MFGNEKSKMKSKLKKQFPSIENKKNKNNKRVIVGKRKKSESFIYKLIQESSKWGLTEYK